MQKDCSIRIRLNSDAMVAYKYLQCCHQRPAEIMRQGGEAALITAAALRKKKERRIPNAPEFLYDD